MVVAIRFDKRGAVYVISIPHHCLGLSDTLFAISLVLGLTVRLCSLIKLYTRFLLTINPFIYIYDMPILSYSPRRDGLL